ncbi:AraC family transcriptional regulator [Sphingomonas sp. BT-65]|uniref:helix-turn-helix domain-containing protein n=1 Tax=Sphingomonas sp. BT-65 TaxID=2989821 RepID=UPI002236B761|nr:AraC family transcriptional regulator [Sphingomonas sp. BT-65]MCW4463264.1 AraC family transcriptional regulator [Sphingomonas sp. BT-65]
MTAVQLEYAVPTAGIADLITLFYHFRADVPVLEDTERADHAQLRFRISEGATEYRMPDGSTQVAPPIHVIGPTSGAMQVKVVGPVHAFGCGITPAGWAALIGNDASTMLNCVFDARDLFGPAVDDTLARIARAPDTQAMVAIAEELIASLARADSPDAAFVRLVDTWLAACASPEIDALTAVTGLSHRQVERKCKALYGAPPKLLARKYRALKAAVAFAERKATLDELLQRGFYDQSHLINEMKQFTGCTPRQLQEQPGLLAQLTISQRSALQGQVNPLISDT